MAESKGNSGSWIDTKTGKVVTSQPEEGVQLQSPEVESNPDDEARVEAAKAAAAAPAEGTDPKTVTSTATSRTTTEK